jgi:hypothetical protein
MHYGSKAFPTKFTVIAPTGYDHATITSTSTYGNNVPGAGMHLNVVIGPTNVSFYAVQILEVGEDASSVSGYFNDHPPPSHKNNGADVWQPIGQNNLVGNGFDNAFRYGLDVMPSPWSPGGGFTWHVPVLWEVGSGTTNSLTSWDQVFTLQADGTFTVSKFGHSVTRTIHNVITTQ